MTGNPDTPLRPRSSLFLCSATCVLVLLVASIAITGLWVTQPVWVRCGPPIPTADPVRLQAHVRMLSESFFPRSSDDTTNLARCATYISQQFATAGAQVSTQQYRAGTQKFDNVIGRFGPSTGACVIVGAHYDACGREPAADDNASGIAGVLELARLLGRGPAPATTVLLVTYCTEEPPYFATPGMGSYQHAKLLKRTGVAVKAMISVEMIGRFDDRFMSQTYPAPLLYAIYPSRGNYVSVIGDITSRTLIRSVKTGMKRGTDLPIWSASLPRRIPGVYFSDHRNYREFGFPAVMVTDTAMYRNHDYHQSADTCDRLDFIRMAKVVDGLLEAVRTQCKVK